MKTQKRDSSGRFTSARAEARKQLIDRAQFLAFHDAVKAMDGETITQTLGKKQAEVERNVKHAQTNAEKYASKTVIFMIETCSQLGIKPFISVSEFLQWLSQPVDKPLPDWPEWPEWVKVGAWIAWEAEGKTVFRKIESVEANQLCFFDGWNARFDYFFRSYKPARVRPFTTKEAVDLACKKIVIKFFNREFVVESVIINQRGCLVRQSEYEYYTLDYLADNATFEDGKPCGVLEVVK